MAKKHAGHFHHPVYHRQRIPRRLVRDVTASTIPTRPSLVAACRAVRYPRNSFPLVNTLVDVQAVAHAVVCCNSDPRQEPATRRVFTLPPSLHPVVLVTRFASRFAVCIHSPPRAAGGGDEQADMYDPDTYHRKFAQYGEIVFVTVCLANGALMKVLIVEGINSRSTPGVRLLYHVEQIKRTPSCL